MCWHHIRTVEGMKNITIVLLFYGTESEHVSRFRIFNQFNKQRNIN